jgi:hypothetical protein
MPRVTQREQYDRQLFLQILWRNELSSSVFGEIGASDQWRVHAFYWPAEDLGRAEFVKHLRELRAEDPELVHVVGKLFRLLVNQQRQRTEAIASPAPTNKAPAHRRCDYTVSG